MQYKKFSKNNQSFTCYNCKKEVLKHSSSSRDHCNHCLYSLHVDINPGDRANECKGELIPIGLDIRNSKEKIVYRCNKCGEIRRCITAVDDNREIITQLSKNIIRE